MTAEGRLRADVLQRIRQDYPPSKREVLVFGRPASAATGPGHPDLFGVACGHFLALEIKYGSKTKPTPLQVSKIQDLRMAGAYAWVVRSTLDATRAVYQAKIGGRMASATDPIDFDDWFKEITSSAPAPSVADKAEPSTADDAAAMDLALDLDASADPDAPTAALPTQDEAQEAQAVANVGTALDEAQAEKPRRRRGKPTADELATNNKLSEPPRPTIDDLQAARDAGLLGADTPEPVTERDLSILVGLVKAVGDRVTEVWEVAMRVDAKQDLILDRLHKLQVDFDTLLEDES